MSDDTTAQTVGQPTRPTPADVAAAHPQRTYTQAELNARDVDAHPAQTGDDIADELASTSDLLALRATVATRHGISDEERDILLTATDEATLELQAGRLVEMQSQRLSLGNRAPREGLVVSRGSDNDRETREFASELFGMDPYA